ncbi:bck1-like resistance to osmotic shock [Tulasnella sp. JGI-2019a]|nr:bck1-like resistance to osmotic shock [Tulasnella sp. JGI-2019a]
MAQSPTIAIPRKKTDDVDWTTPIRTIISQSYGESPDTYAAECSNLQRCRQDAVKGAGSDQTGRDLLYKYFGQLELLELRFSEIRVTFPWHDAFTSKLTTQTSLAFEKASIIFQIASTHSSIAISQNRSDPEGLKRSFHYFKTSAGMLTYINDNFLHAPSTDLSKEVVKFLIGLMLTQATEVFYEKLVDEKKSAALITKVAAQAAYLYNGLTEEVKEFMGRGIFDRNWVTLVQVKAKYFSALSQYHRSMIDSAADQHGDALARLTLAEKVAKEAHRLAQSFSSDFLYSVSPTLPADAGTAITDLTKAFHALMGEKRTEAQRDNDLIYNAIIPAEATLPAIDKLSVASIIPIQEVYGTPEVQKTIGPDLFAKLVPLSVHESASVYSEEKAKLVRSEVEKAELADGDAKAALDSMGLPGSLRKWRQIASGGSDGGAESGVPAEVEAWADEVRRGGGVQGVTKRFADLDVVKKSVDDELVGIANELDSESRECEAMRVRFERWEQEPSAALTRSLRQDLKSHRDAFTAASSSDAQVVKLWTTVHPDVDVLLSGSDALEAYFAAQPSTQQQSLLDLTDDVGPSVDSASLKDLRMKIDELDDRMGRVNKIKRERAEVLKDFKEKIQNDDVSHLLLLNRRAPGNVEPSLFQAELAKFQPYQARLGATIQVQAATIDEISNIYRSLTSSSKSREWLKKSDAKEKRRGEAIGRLIHAKEGWMDTVETLDKGLRFYADLKELVGVLRRNVSGFVGTRAAERTQMVKKLEVAESDKKNDGGRASQPPPIPPPKSPIGSTGGTGLEKSFGSMGLGVARSPPPPPPPSSQQSWLQTLSPPSQPPSAPPVQSPASYGRPQQPSQSYSPLPPPPPPPTRFGSLPPPPPPPQQQQYSLPYSSSTSPPSDPYARLFESLGGAGTPTTPGHVPPPPPPSSQLQYPAPPSSQPQLQYQQHPHYPSQPQPQPQQSQFQSPPPQQSYQYPSQSQYGAPAPSTPGVPSYSYPGQQQPPPQASQWSQYAPPPPPQTQPYGGYRR